MPSALAGGAPVLVTGGAGFVGSHLVERLIELGVRVRCLVRRSSNLRNLPESELLSLAYGDLATGTGVPEAVEDVGIVFHVAGVTKANSNAEFYRGNAEGTENLLRACEKRASPLTRLVHVSSLAAIGPSWEGVPLREDADPHPLTHYGKSKLAGERAVQTSSVAPRAVIVRPPVVYGPRDTDVYYVFRAASKGLLLRIGREESMVSIIQVKDLVEALLAAATSERAHGRAYFVANPQPVSWTEFAAAAAAIMGRRLKDITVPPSAAHAVGLLAEIGARLSGKPGILSREKMAEARCRYWVCDTARAREELEFWPTRSLRDGLAETLAWYKNAGWLKF